MSEDISVTDAYSKGSTAFMGMEMLVAPGALVPRPETELLGTTAVDVLHKMNLPAPRVVDMCCGAGNLACAIAHHVPAATVWASDLTDACVEATHRNIVHHGLVGRVSVLKGDLFEALSTLLPQGTIDLIVCNPPYISEKRLEGDRSHLVALEPREAFAAGPYGIAIHMRVVKDALRYLRVGGALLFEVGLGQDRQVASLMERSRGYENIAAVTNLTGEARVVLGYAKPQP
ncbi:MAG: class I SAM-dependent methyltransferase [Mesorhizobium sp.]|uniref:N5-glutamine methyltransferase family protein n=1 Tax=Mesorhizobium sp. TaxID=1871066 RepID=UPI000FEA1F67|nr:class I SAM-dependent methyltransferase [Mesorhizobium sp.]RWM07760.1 MAG: class I SAM-dependent methyltransferase [Mesorhizobium sp.]TIO52786.1 MAG: class I SAM-dependent methyltransferase [Mesorhizobium sp.]TIO59500.1 MAG: class I SAM-dependent methyltransferase [Mesorhizobium sp.]TJV62937.1 MAG: class I SAM-dependent methyltransferase [Mesorhizobium sp.]